jgi:hypothetical protein
MNEFVQSHFSDGCTLKVGAPGCTLMVGAAGNTNCTNPISNPTPLRLVEAAGCTLKVGAARCGLVGAGGVLGLHPSRLALHARRRRRKKIKNLV